MEQNKKGINEAPEKQYDRMNDHKEVVGLKKCLK